MSIELDLGKEKMSSRVEIWNILKNYAQRDRHRSLIGLFDSDPDRFVNYSLQMEEMLLDYSKNMIDGDTHAALFKLARSVDVEGWRSKMFSGERINMTEGRPERVPVPSQLSSGPRPDG